MNLFFSKEEGVKEIQEIRMMLEKLNVNNDTLNETSAIKGVSFFLLVLNGKDFQDIIH